MPAKRKETPQQPELPIDGPKPDAQGNGHNPEHVQAEVVETIPHYAFVPGKFDSALHRRVDRNFLDYASYVIRDRAIPNLSDGLKPVQRRILWTLHVQDNGLFTKVNTIAKAAMEISSPRRRLHHGRSRRVDEQTLRHRGPGQLRQPLHRRRPRRRPPHRVPSSADLARQELFNDEITDFVPSYDGRSKEPVTLPSKLPLLLMLGTEGHCQARHGRAHPPA